MQLPETYRSFMRRVRRGGIVLRILSLVFIGLGGLALATPGFRPWTAAAFLLAVSCLLGVRHVGSRYVSAWKVSENPQIVYWAHPTTRHEHLADGAIQECELLTLHLRDGTQFELGLPPGDMRDFVTWLSERNASVRFGAYDQPDPATKNEGT
jgi:hypothetical protein